MKDGSVFRVSPFRRRLSCLLMALLCLLMLPAAGCDACSTIIEHTAAFQYFNPPQLVIKGEGPLVYPNVENCYNSVKLNEQLDQYFAPILAAVSSADADYIYFVPDYSLEGTSRNCTLRSELRSCLGQTVRLPDIIIDNGNALPSGEFPDLSYFEDGCAAAGKLYLDSAGMSAYLMDYSETVRVPDMIGFFIKLYEKVISSSTDISRFSADIDYDEATKKAMALGFISTEYGMKTDDPDAATCFTFIECMSAYLKELFNDYYGISSDLVSRSDAEDMTRLFMECYKDEPVIYENWESYRELAETADLHGVPASKLSRRSFASMWVSVYEKLFGEIKTDGAYYQSISVVDTEDEECKKCLSESFMDTFPSYACFSPEYYVHMFELPGYCRSFTWTCYNKWLEINNYSISTDYKYGDLVRSVCRMMVYASRFRKADAQVKTISNDRNYDWYISQYNTGQYSSINCMPTITAMAARWYFGTDTEINVRRLREDWLPEYDDGWYMFQVTGSLDNYDIPYEIVDYDEASGTDIICHELDKGNIILTQMSEAELGVSGHCFIIYGYKKCGDSVRFHIHDPGIYDGTDDFGRAPGDSMWIDSGYVDWIIWRITDIIVSVGSRTPKDEDLDRA